MFRTYQKEDYIFTDKNGVEYISTPEASISVVVALSSFLSVFIPIAILVGGNLLIK